MSPKRYFARIHCIIAREAPLAVVFRRGPAKKTLVLQWNLSSDKFKKGQWLKGRIYHLRSDLSPKGKRLLYMGMGTKGPFTAISNAPYLKALEYFPSEIGTWFGGGRWLSETKPLFDGPDSPPTKLSERVPALSGGDLGLYFGRLIRDGWSYVDRDETTGSNYVFEKRVTAKETLRKIVFGGKKEGTPPEFHERERMIFAEYHQVIRDSQPPTEYPLWEWADVYGRRTILFAEKGCLYRGVIASKGELQRELVADLNPYEFEKLIAPH